MKWLTFKKQTEPGFRFNLTDLIIIIILIASSYIIFSITQDKGFYMLPLYIGITFFIFCNVFRIGNNTEPFWYVPFVITFLIGFYTMESFWPLILIVCEPIKIILIVYRIKKGPYVGAFYKSINRISAVS